VPGGAVLAGSDAVDKEETKIIFLPPTGSDFFSSLQGARGGGADSEQRKGIKI
jgi:hypothetical protein